ncbi:MAG: thymidine phosphorylase [Oscillospiraceae bacterium]|nr:thymidine phosphorylase [Oscillospiraceae bacterium]
MNMYNIISKTKKRIELEKDEIFWLINSYVEGKVPDYQMSAWLMAVCFNSLTQKETLYLTQAMRDSGEKLDMSCIDGITADKHSTGGVGDKTTLIVAPVAAACGVKMPKMSGRGLGHTGGTIDKLESIPGFNPCIDYSTFTDIVNKTGFAIVSQSGNLVPADKKIYALRDTTATVDSIPLICSSIMSKKLALGADCIILDVKSGSGAFMKNEQDARSLASEMVSIAKLAGKKCRALITDMDEPLGSCIGNSLEITEAVEILRGRQKGRLYDLCIELAANVIDTVLCTGLDAARTAAKTSIENSSALEIFIKTLKLQGGDVSFIDDYNIINRAAQKYEVISENSGYISHIDSELIGLSCVELGAGRKVKESSIDSTAGIVINKHKGDFVESGDVIMTLYTSSQCDLSKIAEMALSAVSFSKEQICAGSIVLDIVQ